MSTNRKIAKASFILMLAGACGFLLGIGKEMLVANYFGLTRSMDAFYTAITVPNLIINTLAAVFYGIFIPVYVKYRITDRETANKSASIFINYLGLLFAFLGLILLLFPRLIIALCFSGLDPATAELSAGILRITSATLFLSGLINIFSSTLNANEHFAWPAFSQMFVTLFTMAFVLLFVKRLGVYVLVYGLLAGLAAQFIVLMFVAYTRGFKYSLDFNYKNPAIRESISLAAPFFAAMLLSQLMVAVDRIMASYLPAGSIAALGYSDKIIGIPMNILAASIATAVLPFFSSQVAENRIAEMKDTLATGIRTSAFIFIPLAATILVLAKPAVQVLFQRGAFDAAESEVISKILFYSAFQFLCSYAFLIMFRLMLALKDMASVLKIYVFALLFHIGTNFLFINTVTPPIAGIAVSTSIGYFAMTVVIFYFLKKRITDMHGIAIVLSLSKTAGVSVLSGAATFAVYRASGAYFHPGTVQQLLRLTLASLSGYAVFALLAAVFRFEELQKIYNIFRNKLVSEGKS